MPLENGEHEARTVSNGQIKTWKFYILILYLLAWMSVMSILARVVTS